MAKSWSGRIIEGKKVSGPGIPMVLPPDDFAIPPNT
jgi:hypothetical protein